MSLSTDKYEFESDLQIMVGMTQSITFPDDIFYPTVSCGGKYKQTITVVDEEGIVKATGRATISTEDDEESR